MQTANQKPVNCVKTDLIIGEKDLKQELNNIKIHGLQMKGEKLTGIFDRVSTLSLNDLGKMSGSY